MPSTNSESLTSSFQNYIPVISFCCLIALARSSSIILSIYGESRQSCSVPDFSGITLSFSPFSLMLAIDLLYTAFIMNRFILCIPDHSKTFLLKGSWIISKVLSASNEMIMRFISFTLFIWWITLTDFHMLNYPCISGMKPTWSWWMMVLMCSWIRIASILFSISASMFMTEIGL